MKIAIIGSRNLTVTDFSDYIPHEACEIVSGGSRAIDSCARIYAETYGMKLTEFLPEYNKFGRSAPLKRNLQIIDYADEVIAFWDGKSCGTKYAIDTCKKLGKKIHVIIICPNA